MVRSKLEMKFIGDGGARRKVFKKRVEGVKKKCHELSLLCDIDVFFLCSAPEGEKEFSPHTWPPNKPEVLRILTRYRNRSNEERFKHATTLSANSSKESLRNLLHKISRKRKAARQRLELLKGMGPVGEGASDRKNETQSTLDHSHNLWLVNEEPQRSNGTYVPISCMDPFHQSQTGLGLPSDQLFWSQTQSSSALYHSHNLWLVNEEPQRNNSSYVPISCMDPFHQSQTGLGLPSDQLFWSQTQSSSALDHSHNLWLVNEEPQRSNSSYVPISCMDPFHQSQTGLGLPSDQLFWSQTQSSSALDHSHNLWLVNEEPQRSNSTYVPISCMDPFHQSQTGFGLPSDQLFWGQTQSSSSTDLGFKFINGNMNGFGFNGSNSNNYCIHHAREEFSECLLPTCESHKTFSSTDPSSSFSSVDNYSSVLLMAPSPSPSLASNVLLPPATDFQPLTNSLGGEFWGSDDYLVEQFQGNESLFFQ